MKFTDLIFNSRFVMILYILALLPGLAILWVIEKVTSIFGAQLSAYFYMGFLVVYMILLCAGKAVWTDHGDKIRKRMAQKKQQRLAAKQEDLWDLPPEKTPWDQ